jgi:hypothetical protein
VDDARCDRCGGEVIGPVGLDVVAGGDSGEVSLKVSQTSGIVRRPTRSPLAAMLCTACGNVELRADPAPIADRWRQGDR